MGYKQALAVLTATFSLTLTGCASTPDTNSRQAADAEKVKTSAQIHSIKESIEQAENTLDTAKSNNLDWFATEQMEDARKALTDAKEYYDEFALDSSKANSSSGFFSSKTNLEATQIAIASFKTNIEKAQSIRTNAMTTLESAFDYKTQLTKIGADKYYPNTIKALDRELKKLVDYIGDDKINSAISAQPDLLIKQRALEVKTITKIYLSDAQQQLSHLKQAGIEHYAPKTLSQAAATVTAAEAFINAQPRAIDDIKAKAKAATFALHHTEQVATAVKKLKALPDSAYETYIVDIENRLLRISQLLGVADHRDLPISQQSNAIIEFIKNDKQNTLQSKQDMQALHERLDQQNTSLQKQASQISELQDALAKKTATLENALATQKKTTTKAPDVKANKKDTSALPVEKTKTTMSNPQEEQIPPTEEVDMPSDETSTLPKKQNKTKTE